MRQQRRRQRTRMTMRMRMRAARASRGALLRLGLRARAKARVKANTGKCRSKRASRFTALLWLHSTSQLDRSWQQGDCAYSCLTSTSCF